MGIYSVLNVFFGLLNSFFVHASSVNTDFILKVPLLERRQLDASGGCGAPAGALPPLPVRMLTPSGPLLDAPLLFFWTARHFP